MPLISLKIPPGFARKGTAYSQQGRYRDGNLVRFVEETPGNIGGWQAANLLDTSNEVAEIAGTVRSVHSWRDNLGRAWTAFGSTGGLYVWSGQVLYDVTPVDLVLPGESVGAVLGYGTGEYNTGDYNEPVGSATGNESGSAIEFGYWHLDTWGENLVATIGSDGRVFEWNPNTPTDEAEAIVGAPEYARGLAVTDERHLVVIGAKEEIGEESFAPRPRRVQWSNVEDNTDFVATPVSLAGELNLVSQGVAVRVIRFREETLIFTDADLHRMVYLGYPGGYGLKKIGDDCGIANPGAVSKNANLLFWVGPRGFFVYDGNQVNAIDSELFNTPGDAAALLARNGKTAVGHNELFNEFWIFYPSTAEGNPDRYIIWNYKAGWWADGEMDRTCWYDSYVTAYPIATQPYTTGEERAPKSRVLLHEVGSQRPFYTGAAESLNSAPVEIGKGDQFLFLDRIMQDSDIDEGARLQIGLKFYKAPNIAPLKVVDPVPLNTTRGYTDVRGTGRMVALEISARGDSNGAWRVGNWRANVRPGEGR